MYLETILAMQRLSLEMGKDKWITGLTDIHPGADLAASFRDPQQLCVDLMDAPEQVHALMRQIFWFFFDFYNMQRATLAAGQTVTCAWLPMYCSDGRYYIPSCDFSIMVSTEMFREFFLPELLAEIAGSTARCITWTGRRAAPPGHAARYRGSLTPSSSSTATGPSRLRAGCTCSNASRPAARTCTSPSSRVVDTFMENLRPEGVMLQMEASSVEEADAVLQKLARWK